MIQGNKNHTIKAIICGAQKAGTTSLSYYLRQHPELDVPNEELHFFDNENVDWENPNYREYEKQFESEGKIRIDHTPIYMFWEPCCARIYRYNPNMKIIAILRNPSERAYSQWAMEHNRGSETLSFPLALQNEMDTNQSSPNKQHRVRSYIHRGMYCSQIKRLWHHFGRENVFITKHENLRDKTQETVQSICHHLGIKTDHRFDKTKQRIGRYPTANAEETLSHLVKIFHNEIEELEKLLDWDCSNWK